MAVSDVENTIRNENIWRNFDGTLHQVMCTVRRHSMPNPQVRDPFYCFVGLNDAKTDCEEPFWRMRPSGSGKPSPIFQFNQLVDPASGAASQCMALLPRRTAGQQLRAPLGHFHQSDVASIQ